MQIPFLTGKDRRLGPVPAREVRLKGRFNMDHQEGSERGT